MKTTPLARSPWSIVLLGFAGVLMLLWGCGQTREIVYPGRKISPPRVVKPRLPGLKRQNPPALEANEDPLKKTPSVPEPPAIIDVPILNRIED